MKKHYAQIYKDRIWFLEKMIKRYYMANYRAKQEAGIDCPVCCVTSLSGNEESMTIKGKEELMRIIDDLPLWDCGT